MAVWRKTHNASDGRRSLRALRYALFLILTAPAWCQDSPTTAADEQVALWFEAARQAHAEGDLPLATAEYEKVLRATPEIPEMHSNLGVVYYLQGRYADALERFDDALTRKPDLFVALLFSGMSHVRMRGYKKAVPRLEKALSQQSDSYEALLYLGLSHAGSEHYKRAHTYFEKLVDVHPKDIAALNQLGRNYLELSTARFKRMWDVAPEGFIYFRTLGQLGAAQGKPTADVRRQYERAIAARPDYPNLHWELAQVLLRANDLKGAAARLSEEIEVEPHHVPALLALAGIHEQLGESGRWAELVDRGRKTAQRTPTTEDGFSDLLQSDPALAVSLLNNLLESGDLERSVSQFIRRQPKVGDLKKTLDELWGVVQARPHNDWFHEVYFRCRMEQGEVKLARDQLLLLKRQSPDRAMPYYLLGKAYQRLSIRTQQRMVDLDPDSYRTHLLKAEVLDKQDDYENAIAEYRAALKAEADVPGVHYQLGMALIRTMQLEEAIRAFQKELEIDPYHLLAQVRLGQIHTYRSEHEKAISHLLEAVKLDSSHAMAYGTLGRAYMLAGRPGQAVEMLERSVKLDPDNRKARYQLATIYRRQGRKEEADRELAAFRKLSQQEMNELGRRQQESLFDSDLPGPEN